jgi:hypothetical protein
MDSFERALGAVKQYDPDALMRLYHGARDLSHKAKEIHDADVVAGLPYSRFDIIAKDHTDEADCYLRAYAVLRGVKPIGVQSVNKHNINMRFLFTDEDYMWLRLKWA